MLNNQSRLRLAIGAWSVTVAMAIGATVAAGARPSTSALLLLVCLVPMGVALMVGVGGPPPTVAEVLYVANRSKDGE